MTRNGKIARLPEAIRQDINQRLLDGEQGKPLVEWLNGLPKVQAVLRAKFNGNPITENNLSQWKNGGFPAWEGGEQMADSVSSIIQPEENKQRIRQILGLGPGYDGSKSPELTRPPALRGDPVQASTSQYK